MAVDCMSLKTQTIPVLAECVLNSLQKLILRTSDTSKNAKIGKALGRYEYSTIRRLQELLVLVGLWEGEFALRFLLELELQAKPQVG
jgi:hypothetical protein